MTESVFEVTETDGGCSASARGETYNGAGHGC